MNCKRSGIELCKTVVVSIIIIVIIAILKYRSGEINYLNSDATWHTLLTIEAYNETSIKDHKFLPIVTLGSDEDKYIRWGVTLPDEKGNYYYTSFSPAGFFFPWAFMKLFGLEITEKSLYIFNTVLFIISSILWLLFIFQVYRESRHRVLIQFVALFTYALSPEILHGMGIVYWHQSLMQVTFLLQLLAYYNMRMRDSKYAKYLFFATTIMNPYIEWTGFISNVGFAIAECIWFWNKNRKLGFIKMMFIGFLTVLSLGIFVGHYLMVLEPTEFFASLKSRFLARGVTTATQISDIFCGYIKSFLYLWVLIFILCVWNFIKNGKLVIRHGYLFLVLMFPLVENIIMKQHAVGYTYDRMKGSFVLSFLICELVYGLLNYTEKSKMIINAVLVLTLTCGILNFQSYISNESYIWETDYRDSNIVLSEYINENYPNALLTMDGARVRGYVNMLFQRGIYEGITADSAKEMAQKRQNDFVVMLHVDESAPGGMHNIGSATIYDLKNNMIQEIIMENGVVYITDMNG